MMTHVFAVGEEFAVLGIDGIHRSGYREHGEPGSTESCYRVSA